MSDTENVIEIRVVRKGRKVEYVPVQIQGTGLVPCDVVAYIPGDKRSLRLPWKSAPFRLLVPKGLAIRGELKYGELASDKKEYDESSEAKAGMRYRIVKVVGNRKNKGFGFDL
jgi:hypothetical protein